MLNNRTAAFSALCAVLCAAILFTALGGVAARHTHQTATTDTAVQPPAILIDAGHGGADGGAVGCDGILEKDVNLAIALSLGDLVRLCGYPLALSRTEDTSLHTEGSSVRAQKVSDLKNRLAMTNASLLTVSIHQNQFAVSKYSGAQVFYSPSPDSERLATLLQQQLVQQLQPDNTRQCKRAGQEIYLLANATRPAVIVECGFLSNPQECALLGQSDYQKQVAFAVLSGILEYQP